MTIPKLTCKDCGKEFELTSEKKGYINFCPECTDKQRWANYAKLAEFAQSRGTSGVASKGLQEGDVRSRSRFRRLYGQIESSSTKLDALIESIKLFDHNVPQEDRSLALRELVRLHEQIQSDLKKISELNFDRALREREAEAISKSL